MTKKLIVDEKQGKNFKVRKKSYKIRNVAENHRISQDKIVKVKKIIPFLKISEEHTIFKKKSAKSLISNDWWLI